MSGDALRELLVSFGVEVDTEELKKGEKEVEGFGSKLKKFGALVAEAFALHEVKEFIEGQIEAGAQLKVTAERLGTTTDELQAMRLAAGEAGVSVESMDTSLRILNRNIGKASDGGGEQAATFAKLGIALKDAGGLARPVGDIMGDIADKVAETGSTAEKTRISMELLGRGGSQLIPLLNKGGEAFKEATKDVADLGGGMSGEFVEAAHKAEEANVRLGFAMTGLKSNIANALIPGFSHLVEGMTDFVKEGVDVEKKSHIIETSMEFLKGVAIVGGLYKIVTALQAVTAAELMAALPVVIFVAALAAALVAYNDLSTALTGGESVFGNYFGQTGIETLKDDLDDANDALEDMVGTLTTMATIMERVAHFAAIIGNSFAWAAKTAANVVETIGDVQVATSGMPGAGTAEGALARGKARQGAIGAQGLANATDQWGQMVAPLNAKGWGGSHRKQTRHAAEDEYSQKVAGMNLAGPDYAYVPGSGGPSMPWNMMNEPSVPVSAGAHGAAAGGGRTVIINQNNPVKIELHPAASDVNGVKAVGRAVSTEQQRSNATTETNFKVG